MFPPRAPVARLLGVLLFSLTALAHAAGPSPKAPTTASPKAPGTPFPQEVLHASELFYSVLLFHPAEPKGNVVASANALLAAKYRELSGAWKPGAPAPEVVIEAVPWDKLDPINEEHLRYFGGKVEPEDRKRLMGAKHATALNFHIPFAKRHESLLAAMRFAHQFATEQKAILWDAETREYFSPKRWKETRVDGWTGAVPSLPSHITMHVYADGGAQRMVTLGMVKLGLPDLVVEQVPGSMTTEMGKLVNAVAQLLTEGLEPAKNGELTVDVTRVKDARVQRMVTADDPKTARRNTKLWAIEGRRDNGDPENPLLEITFPGSGSAHERQLAALDALFGKKPDNITAAPPGDPELEAVARKARARLNELRPRIAKGLHPPEVLLVKAGFRTDDDNLEYMWMEVVTWEKDRLKGTLANEPFNVSRLRRGSPVDVAESEVQDYLYMSPNGTREGGESSTILMRREQQGR
ncbi:DUF2314 domain-containing protein [Archangium lipolyticum]|uniref:DUF2314 domain-containing protein n=1 Tax=Archangium lipolyticum TaxID=2970465 RepID=UPI00214A0065|nr:DUF2314 domain-containing protein [Archangium lipolyticum]